MKMLGKVVIGCGLGLTLAASAPAALVARYAFDGNAQDSSGNGYDGTTIGTVAYAPGVSGSALHFDGSSTVVTVPYASPLVLANSSYTVAFWANLDEVKNQAFVSGSDNQADFNGGYTLATRNGGAFLSIHNSGGTANTYDFPTADASTANGVGVWTHYALVYNTAADTRTLYVNGVAKSTAATTLDLSDRGSEPLRIGALFNADIGYFYNFHGSMDDVRIYNEALATPAIAALVPEPTVIGLAGLAVLGLGRRFGRR